MTTKQALHRLVDELPEGNDLSGVAEFLRDLLGLLSTPEGETPLTTEEILRLLDAKRESRAGGYAAFDDVEEAIRYLHQQAGE